MVRHARHLLLAASLVLPACDRGAEVDAIPGARLGMTPADIRKRFAPGAEGTWQTNLGAGDDTSVEWRSKDPASRFADVRFEFHMTMLVAARAHLREATPSESVRITPRTVTVRTPAEGGTTALTVLARDCPTHHEEAESLVAKAH